MGLKM